jgi:DNA-directed RNA polymerase specialized sigma24 family protein
MDDGELTTIYGRVVRHAQRVCPADPAIDAEDVVQAAWLKCGALLPTLATDLDRLRLWTRCVNQVATDHHRRAQRATFVPLGDWQPGGARVERGVSVEREALARVELAGVLALVAAGDLFAAAAVALAVFGDGALAAVGCRRGTLGSRVSRFRAAHGGMHA